MSDDGAVIVTIGPDWLPTADNINALPEPLRHYIHLLETRCDPSGHARLVMARDTVGSLERMLQEKDI